MLPLINKDVPLGTTDHLAFLTAPDNADTVTTHQGNASEVVRWGSLVIIVNNMSEVSNIVYPIFKIVMESCKSILIIKQSF